MEETQHARDQQKERLIWLLWGEHMGMQSGCPQGHGKPVVSSREVPESHTWSASGRSEEEGGVGAGNLVGRDGRKGLQLPESLRIWEEVRGRKRGDLQDIFKKEKN